MELVDSPSILSSAGVMPFKTQMTVLDLWEIHCKQPVVNFRTLSVQRKVGRGILVEMHSGSLHLGGRGMTVQMCWAT